MTSDEEHNKRIAALIRKHESTIRKVSALYYVLGSYSYNELVCNLTTYLWQVYNGLPAGTVIRDEHAWVFVILYRQARDLVRNESTYQRRMVYGANLSTVADSEGQSPEVSRLYRLVEELDEDERRIILMYIDKIPVKQIALQEGKDYRGTHRSIERIKKKLRKLNIVVEDIYDWEKE